MNTAVIRKTKAAASPHIEAAAAAGTEIEVIGVSQRSY
jgi:hypothetical protein